MKIHVCFQGIWMLLVGSCWGWGPHWDITQAALHVLPSNHVTRAQFADQLTLLTNYCWLPDFKQLPFRTVTVDFYADDYLLFPGMVRHLDHICPEVEKAYTPYFQRALQAMRTESSANAARWIGSLLHFVQDSGSPPHALQMRGEAHIRMENWVDRGKILIPGYEPRLLGTNDADALDGLQRRMRELIAFSRARGQRLRTPVLIGNRRAAEPIALESALECARVTADVLHTLGTLTHQFPAHGFHLAGMVQSKRAASDGRFPARLMVHGTNISTLADGAGRFSLRGLSAGDYRLSVLQPGSTTLTTNISLKADATNVLLMLPSSGNLVRNGDFSTHWMQPDVPDCWSRLNATWEGEILALQPGQRYRARAEFAAGSKAEVTVRWSREQPFVLPKPTRVPRIESRSLNLKAPEFIFTASSSMALMQLSVRGAAGHPTNAVRYVSVMPLAE